MCRRVKTAPTLKIMAAPESSCFFALEIEKISLAEELAEETSNENQEFFSNLAKLKLHAGNYCVGLRYSLSPCTEGSVRGKVRVFLLFRVDAHSPDNVEKAGRELWENVSLCLPLQSGAYTILPVTDSAVLDALFTSRPCYFVEILRRYEQVLIKNKHHIHLLYPFLPSESSIDRFLAILISLSDAVHYQVWFRPAKLSQEERERLQENNNICANSALKEFSQETASQMLHCANRLAQDLSFNDLVELRIGLISESAIPLSLAQIAGYTLTRSAIREGDLHGGGFDMSSFSPGDNAESSASLARLGFDPSDNAFGRLRSLFSLNEGMCTWKLPLPHEEGVPGIAKELLRPIPLPENLPSQGISLGVYPFDHAIEIFQKERDRALHTYIVGQTGTGKTTVLTRMILQDIKEGRGVGVLDPHGDLIGTILAGIPEKRIDDVILFDPGDTDYPPGLNLLEATTPHERDFVIQEAIMMFYRLFDPGRTGIVGPQFEHWMRNAALTLLTSTAGGTLIDIPYLFIDEEFRDDKLSDAIDPVARSFWEKQLRKTSDFHKSEMFNYFISKFGRFLANSAMRNIIGQVKSSFNFRKVMDEGKILLVNLAKGQIGEFNCETLGMILISKFFLAAASRTDIPKEARRPFYLYVDEFQSFTTDSFETILSEARKFRLMITMAHQFTSQLPDSLRAAVSGNVGTVISFRVGTEDADLLQIEFEPWFSAADLKRLPNYHACVRMMIDGEPSRALLIGVPRIEGLKEKKKWAGRVRDRSREQWAKPVKEVEREIFSRLKMAQPEEEDEESRQKRLLKERYIS